MEGSVRSDGIVKKKSSSGCLIIKKKGQGGNGVGVGWSKEKKRPRMIMSDSDSSDEVIEAMRRKTGEKIHDGGVGFRRSSGDDREFARKGEFECQKKSRKKFEFDNEDDFGGRGVRNEYRNADGKMKMARRISEGSRDFGESGSWRNSIVQKRKHSCIGDSNSVGRGRSKGVGSGDRMSKLELDEAEAQLPISLLSLKYQEIPDKPIRFQGKNGVLKVMVNNMKKKTNYSCNDDDDDRGQIENKKGPRFEVNEKKDLNLRPPLYSGAKHMEKRISIDIGRENISMTRHKSLGKRSMDDDLDLEETDTSLKLAPPSLHASSVLKVKKEERSSTENCLSVGKKEKHKPSNESITPVSGEEGKRISTGSSTPAKGKEVKVKGGGSTEKQKLRETIREMLIEAGWTIDYRPRRNRDYLDAVYINPSGTAYWSIIKAYDAFKKQFNGQQSRSKSVDLPSSFTPLSEDLISKLTRQTRKKIEEKMKKRREDGMSRNTKKAASKESMDAMESDQPEGTPYSWLRKNLKLSKAKMQNLHHETGDESSDDTCKQTTKGDRDEKSLDAAKNIMSHGTKSRVTGRCILRVRDSKKAQNSESDGYVPYTGKRTVLAWLVDSGIVQSGEKVQYMNRKRTRVKLEGWITKEGIHCGCCSKILTVAKFELHAGSKLRRPFQNIYMESGVSLLQCQIDAWNRQKESERQDFYTINVDGDDPDDDACGTCGDGGDLICCDSCPSTFHQSCLEIKMVPLGDWHCPNCVCKFCGTAKKRNDAGGDLSLDELTTCSLCERKYHKLCSSLNGATLMDSSSGTAQFCGHKCQELYDHVWKILGVKHELEAGFSWSLIQRTDIDSDVTNSGFAQRVECNSKLAVAHSVIDECFLPIIDRRSKINLIHNVLYNCGANFPRLNFGSFYCAILERGDDLISVASIRIHGTQLAEMPFIGTRHIYRRQGMCSRLLSAIELSLSSFKVEKLIIPAISEHLNTWTTAFGFTPLEEDLKKDIKSINMLVFPGTDMLQKQLAEPMTDDVKAIDLTVGHPQPPASARKSSYIEDEGEDVKLHLNKNLDKFDVDSGYLDSAAPSKIPDSTFKSGIRLSIIETTSDQNNQVMESASGSKFSSSPSASSTSLLGLEKPADLPNKDSVQSFMEIATGEQPTETVEESSGKDLYDVPKDHEDSDVGNLAEMDGKDFINSDVASHTDVNKDSVESFMEIATGEQPARTVEESSGKDLYVVPKDHEDSDVENLAEMDRKDFVNFGVASDTDVNIQSTPCKVKTKDDDIADSSFDNSRTDVNGRSSHFDDGSNNRCLSFSKDFNTLGAYVKDDVVLVSTNDTVPKDHEDSDVGNLAEMDVKDFVNSDVASHTDVNKDKVESYMEIATGEQPAGTVKESSGNNMYAVQKDHEDSDVENLAEMDRKDFANSGVASDPDVNMQSTPCEVKTEDDDIADSSFDNSGTDISGRSSRFEDGSNNGCLSFSKDLNKPGVYVKDDVVLVSATDAVPKVNEDSDVGNLAEMDVKDFVNSDVASHTDAAGTVKESSGEDWYAVPKDHEDSDVENLADLDGKDFVNSGVASNRDVNIQSTPCEVKTNDDDITDSSFGNCRADVNGTSSRFEDGSNNGCLGFSEDLNKPRVYVKDDVVLVSATDDVPKDHEDSDAKILAEMDGKDFAHSDVASDADFSIQSTSGEVKTKDHEIDDSSFDNVLPDVNGRSSLLEDGSKNRCPSFSTDLNKPGVDVKEDGVLVSATDAEVASVKALPDTSSVCEVVGNRGDDSAGAAASFEHANAFH